MRKFFTKVNFNPLKIEPTCNTPDFCKHNFSNDHKKCKKYYSELKHNLTTNKVIVCPYGFSTVVYDDNVYTGIILSEDMQNRQLINNLKSRQEKIINFITFPRNRIISILDTTKKDTEHFSTIEDAFHDFKNIMYSVANILEKHENYSNVDDNDFKTLLGLSDLMRNRIRVIDEINDDNRTYNNKSLQCIHPLFYKLKNMMITLIKKKDLVLSLEKNTQYNKFELSEEVFLGIFIIFENAIKHAVPKSTIYITFDEHRKINTTYVEIENESFVIYEEEIPKLTNRGYRGINTISNGTGLGLSKAVKLFNRNNIGFRHEVIRNGEMRSTFKIILEFSNAKNTI